MEDIKCNKTGCKGKVDTEKAKFINATKMQGKCKECGKSVFYPRKADTPYNKVVR